MPPFWHPGGPFWHLGGTLGDHGSSRMDTGGSRIRFVSIFGRFWDPILNVFLAPRAKILFFFPSLFPGHFLYRFLSRNPDAWGFQNQVFAWKVLQKPTFHRNRFLKFVGSIVVDFFVFFGGLGATFLIFVALEKGLKIDGFSGDS